MSGLSKKLNLLDGVALGIGSIMGSGALFLPSYSYAIGGDGAILAWMLTTLLCLPLIIVFKAMVNKVPNESGLHGWVSLGLGEKVGAAVPFILLGTVSLGMPSAAIIAGKYVSNTFLLDQTVTLFVAISIVVLASGTNLLGIELSSRNQRLVSLALFLLAGSLAAMSAPMAFERLPTKTFKFGWNDTVLAAVICFWAFAGFENMSFMAGEFKNPKRDLPLAIAYSLIICSLIYISLTFNYLLIGETGDESSLDGLRVLGEALPSPYFAKQIIWVFAVTAVLMNFISWVWGISRLIFSTANQGLLPATLGKIDEQNGIPRNAILLLSAGFIINIFIFSHWPDVMDLCLKLVSTNFLFLYLLAITSYLRLNTSHGERALGVILTIICSYGLFTTGYLVLYPISILILSVLFLHMRTRINK